MKKRIIITALSIMLASTAVMPAYAAEPLPNVETSFQIGPAVNQWTEQFIDECNAISDPKERYRHIVQLVAANLDQPDSTHYGEEAVLTDYSNHVVDVNVYVGAIVHLSNKCGLEAYQVEARGNVIIADGKTNFFPCVYFDGTPYLTVIADVEAERTDYDSVLLPNGTYGLNMVGDPRVEAEPWTEEELKYHTTIDLQSGISVIYDSDGTYTDLLFNNGGTAPINATDKYYICEKAALRSITLDELLALGYEGPY